MIEPHVIDLRSDTVTQPTPAMRQAMAEAELGDDVYGEDPTVCRLEEMAAERMGKEAAVLVASGTMANLISMLAHCGRGDEAIVGDEAHVLHYEAGGVPALGAIQLRTVPNDGHGMLDLDALEATIRGKNVHFPRTAAVCLENTHNRCSGGVLSPEETAAIARVARAHDIAVHLDGARIFNAGIALGVPVTALTEHVDSVSFCLSKGLSAPVGSLVCGSRDFVARARRARKMVGGGMRQAGIIAAPGIVALETMIERLAEDHEHAALLANGLAQIQGLGIDPASVQTNIVVVEVREGVAFQKRMRGGGVLISAIAPDKLRMVTHYGITRAHIEQALACAGRAIGQAA